ncbi:ABC transporter permease [Thermoactinospora rubra]|uniref:ABC transporter permease n=1 Tax=Thermoactinospora rubra TaxID=1088767 RepID=UPI000A1129D8|nr:ABC transporter permease [Thermoactinospora rubra]
MTSTSTRPAPPGGRPGPAGGAPAAARRSRRLAASAFLGPGLTYLLVFLLIPLALVFAHSVFRRGRFGGVVYEFTTENFTRLIDPLYLGVVVDSLKLATIATVIALLVGYPTAYAIAHLPPRWKTVALVAIVLPFLTSFIIRMFALIILMSGPGLINRLLGAELEMLYTDGAIVTGLLYAYLPLMVLPLYSAIERLDPQLREASANLGASAFTTFRRVTFPLTLPGVMTGCMFVFVPSFGNFAVPELLGGGKSLMVGNLVQTAFLRERDYPFGSALALTLIAVLLVLLVVQAKAARHG